VKPFREVVLTCTCGGRLEPTEETDDSTVRCIACKQIVQGLRAKVLDPQKEFMIDARPSPGVRLRPADEVQRAHDLLVPIILGEIQVEITEAERAVITANTDVLCWVLQHDHSQTFANNLDLAEQQAAAVGFRLKHNAKMDEVDRSAGSAAPADCTLDLQLRIVISAVVAGITGQDWDCVAQGLAILQDVELSVRTGGQSS
jgi:hypothetical protein